VRGSLHRATPPFLFARQLLSFQLISFLNRCFISCLSQYLRCGPGRNSLISAQLDCTQIHLQLLQHPLSPDQSLVPPLNMAALNYPVVGPPKLSPAPADGKLLVPRRPGCPIDNCRLGSDPSRAPRLAEKLPRPVEPVPDWA
jgi:hypothetical protein